MPQITRNFLEFADTVPGVVFEVDAKGRTSIRGGAQNDNGVNVYIDGVGQKGYVRSAASGRPDRRHAGQSVPAARHRRIQGHHLELQGGVRPDLERRHHGPHAIRHQRVRGPGLRHLHGRQLARARRRPRRAPARKTESESKEYGFAFGGPIIQDRMHFFLTYEAKEFVTPITIVHGDGQTSAGLVAQLPADVQPRSSVPRRSPFDEDLFFAKLDWRAHRRRSPRVVRARSARRRCRQPAPASRVAASATSTNSTTSDDR